MSDTAEDDLVQSIKHLIIDLHPYVRDAGSVEQAEHTLTHLEEINENFHKYDFVKRLKAKIEFHLGTLIEEEIENHSVAPKDDILGHESLVSKIINDVLNCKEYIDMTRDLKKNIMIVCDQLIQNFDQEFGSVGQMKPYDTERSHARHSLISDCDSSIGDSTFNQSTIMFLSPEQYQQIADNLDKHKRINIRIDALKNLFQVPYMDVQNYEVWNLIRQALVDSLLDPNEQLWGLALKYCARGFFQHTGHTKDVYSILVDYLSIFFKSWKTNIPHVKIEVDCSRPEIIRILKTVRLLNEFQQNITQYWVRFSDRVVIEIIEKTLQLLSIGVPGSPGSNLQMAPVQFLSLVDLKANWFIKWMHGHYSRAHVLRLLEVHKNIIEDAVQACFAYAAFKPSGHSGLAPESYADRNMKYSGPELELVHFVHSLHLVCRLLCHDAGQQLFPMNIPGKTQPVTLTDLLVVLVKLIHRTNVQPSSKSNIAQLDPGNLVTTMFKKLCSSESVCDVCICKDEVIETLLMPVNQWLAGVPITDIDGTRALESTLLHVADILSAIASSSRGRQHLLYGESGGRFTRSKSTAVYLIADFARKALNGDLSIEFAPSPSNAVVGAFVFICRQLYNTCEGLLVMYPFDLHTCIADAWQVANREADNAATPTPSASGSEFQYTNRENQYLILWEDTLRDNLLNFTGTPKGVLFLQQTGAFNDCVHYMYSRYARKLQVSKCEKFGYGFMMTQVAATAPGVAALQYTGFLKALIKELWGAIEVIDDKPVVNPKPFPLCPVDKAGRKPFTRLLNILSAFPAVFEILSNQELPLKKEYGTREIPQSIVGLLDRIVMINSDAKMYSLYNYENSHAFGLRVLSVMVSCLDTMLLLQSQYSFQNILLQAQAEDTHNGGRDIIIDMLSVERNYVLVKSFLVGGPTERILPPRDLVGGNNGTNIFPHSMFSSFPVPKEYIPSVPNQKKAKGDQELVKCVADAKKGTCGPQWLEKCRSTYFGVIKEHPEKAQGSVLQEMLECVIQAESAIPEEVTFPLSDYTGSDSALKNYSLTQSQKLGVSIAIRYGVHLKLLSSGSDAEDKLTQLLKRCGFYLQMQQRSTPEHGQLQWLSGNYVGFDWFSASVFLMMQGNLERAWQFLYKFSALSGSAYLWPPRLHKSIHVPVSLMASGITPLYSSTGHNVELILQAEAPHVFSAFRMSGYSPSQISQHWLHQCFWNYLDWPDICQYICVTLMRGVDYQVYICVAILHFLQREVLRHHQQQDLVVFLKEEPIRGFHVGQYLSFMADLEAKFRKTVLPDMMNLAKP